MSVRNRDREIFPHVEDAIGEDPARFLDRDLLAEDTDTVEARIRGIDSLEVIARWQAVEAALVRTPDGGRSRVRDLLQRRAREIETLGNRDEQLERRREVVIDDQDDVEDEPTVWRHLADDCGSTNVEEASRHAFRCNGCDMRVPSNRVEVVEA